MRQMKYLEALGLSLLSIDHSFKVQKQKKYHENPKPEILEITNITYQFSLVISEGMINRGDN